VSTGYVFQSRLKIAGGWWKMENLKKMIALRVFVSQRQLTSLLEQRDAGGRLTLTFNYIRM
jgi:hypothetical protein